MKYFKKLQSPKNLKSSSAPFPSSCTPTARQATPRSLVPSPIIRGRGVPAPIYTIYSLP